MRISALLALALVLGGSYFGYRVARLEQRVDALQLQLGRPAPEGTASDKPDGAGTGGGHEHRLLALERDVTSLRDELRTLEQARARKGESTAAQAAGNEKQILSVVDREQSRIRDRQLEFHRTRMIEGREAALEDFAQRYGLSPSQTDQLHELLTDEVDRMVEILRRRESLENPEQATADWMATLEQTDDAAHRVLDPAQRGPWDQARAVERHVLWPWLPNDK